MAQAKKKKSKKAAAAPAQPPRALLYCLDEGTPKGDRVRGVLADLGIRPVTVAPAQLDDAVGYLAGVKGFRPAGHPFDGEAPDIEFMVLCDVPGKTMDALLPAMHDADAYVGAKCVLTPHNRMWPLRILINQVAQEHAAMTH